MRVVALLCIIFGFMMQGILDGQTFTHAVLGVVFGVVAITCGLASARKDPPHRFIGRFMAVLGLGLGVWCIIMLPSAYQFQERFNGRREQRKHKKDETTPANKPTPANRAMTLRLTSVSPWRPVAEPGCWAKLHQCQV